MAGPRPGVGARLWTGSPFGRRVPREIVDDLLAFVRNLLTEAPRTRAQLRRLLGQRWPKLDADAMAYAAQYLLPIVQVTPRGYGGDHGADLGRCGILDRYPDFDRRGP